MSNALETHIRKIARALHEHQIARLYKIPNDIKIVDGQLIHAEQTPADFLGFTITGRVILLECKMRLRTSLELGPKGLKAHQQIAINEAHKAGGLGLLAWMNGDQVAVIDAGQVNAYRKGKKSIAWNDIHAKYKHTLHEDPKRFFWPFLI
jgi:penicillin-binding protein-related factor A (putative recombinase)